MIQHFEKLLPGAKLWKAAALPLLGLVLISWVFRLTSKAPAQVLTVNIQLTPPSGPVPMSLFGMHIHHIATTTPWPIVPFGTWRLWDAYVSWPWLAPQKNTWDFTVLDQYVALAEQKHVEILLPLGLSPAWASARPAEPSAYSPGYAAEPASIDDWRDYVRTVATRYKNRVRYYEIWNEPNLPQFFSGTSQQMLQLSCAAYTVLKQVDPAVQVVSPSATAAPGVQWLAAYLQAGGASCADIIGFHFYVSPQAPEAMVRLIFQVRDTMANRGAANKPLWNTETGWLIQNSVAAVLPQPNSSFSVVLTPSDASAYVARSYILNWAAGVSRFYWYSWDSSTEGLTEPDGKTLKPAASAYLQVERWLVGWVMKSCVSDANGTWTCEMSRPPAPPRATGREWIVWNPNGPMRFRIPATWDVRQSWDLSGSRVVARPSAIVAIGPAPVLFENVAP